MNQHSSCITAGRMSRYSSEIIWIINA